VTAPTGQPAHLAPADSAAGGFAIETSVLARLLGMKLLTLEGVVLVSPAQVRQLQGANGTPDRSATGATPAKTVVPAATTPVTGRRSATTDHPGNRLAQAAHVLEESSKELRQLGGSEPR
jgi:hypothetical protein